MLISLNNYTTINHKVLFRDIIVIFSAIFIVIYLCAKANSYTLNILSSIWFGFWLHALFLFMHEGAHFNIYKNKKINDILVNLFSVPLFATRIQFYRKKHFLHHKLLGKKDDIENSYFNDLNFIFILKSLCAINPILRFLNYKKGKKIEIDSLAILLSLTFHVFLIAFLYSSNYLNFIYTYFFTFFVFFPFFSILRQVLEHRSFTADKNCDYSKIDMGEVNRIFGSDFFSRYFGAAGFNKHLIHHMYPNISYTRFNSLEEKLLNNKKYSHLIIKNKSSYINAFVSLLKN